MADGEGGEPAAAELVGLVQQFYAVGGADVSDMGDGDAGVSFAGLGEPLLRLDTLLEAVRGVKETNHGVPFRVVTNGLVDAPADVAGALKGAGVGRVSIALMAHMPPLYDALMAPQSTVFVSIPSLLDASLTEQYGKTMYMVILLLVGDDTGGGSRNLPFREFSEGLQEAPPGRLWEAAGG